MLEDRRLDELEVNRSPELLDSNPYIELGDRHLKFRDDTPFEVWEAVFKRLKSAEQSVQWWIGDALRFGERRYGEMYAQAVEETDYSYSALSGMAYVAGQVEVCRRRQNLSYSHHQEIAPLPPEDQERWLSEAEPEPDSKRPKLSRNELREHIRDEKRATQGEDAPALSARDLSFREMEEKADAMLHFERDREALNKAGLTLRAVPIAEPLTETPILPAREESAGKKWSSAMHDIQMRLNSIRDMGGVEAMTATWNPKDREVLRERLRSMSKILQELSDEGR